jgi:hypothetical protein
MMPSICFPKTILWKSCLYVCFSTSIFKRTSSNHLLQLLWCIGKPQILGTIIPESLNNSWCVSFSHFCASDDCFHFHAGGYIGCAFLPDHHNFQMLFVYKKTFWLRASGHSRFIRCCSGANFWFLWAGMSFFGTNRSAEKSTSSWLRGALACGH